MYTLNLPIQVGWLVSEPQGPSCLCLLALGIGLHLQVHVANIFLAQHLTTHSFYVLRQGSHLFAQSALNLLCSLGWPQSPECLHAVILSFVFVCDCHQYFPEVPHGVPSCMLPSVEWSQPPFVPDVYTCADMPCSSL